MRSFSEHEKRFAARILHIRTIRQLTQNDLAALAGTTRHTIGKIENTTRTCGLGEAAAIANALDVPLADLIAAEPITVTTHHPVD